jgi:hypothetical protein
MNYDIPCQIKSKYQRLTQVGFNIEDMKQLYQKATDPAEKARIEKIEMLDEWEEWNIMQTHYFISVSTNFDEVLMSEA